ncbi:MAG: CDP-glucose 4,6-dehydratase [Oxalobacter sp.]|nr:MAG: CDP-glucose 4,6-dehydratase [Oxalobacter sp.]
MNAFENMYNGRRVLVTGHTGFKGSWLVQWLLQLGAVVAGYSVDIPSVPSNFELLGLEKRIRHYVGDIRDLQQLCEAIDDFKPDVIFHMAAQALVRRSYAEPALTFETNTLGMVNLLECVRQRKWIEAVVLITSDKAYRNDEWCWGYREIDALGGHDPYSASKSCADLIAQSYVHSFMASGDTRVGITRAGNVIGGGDWAADRIVPDGIRAWSQGKPVEIRSPQATRPWQHVLEPLSGYLWLGARLLQGTKNLHGEAFNFGPDAKVNQTVAELLDAMTVRWPGTHWHVPAEFESQGREAMLLKLSCDKALFYLQWFAILDFHATVAFTVDWYRNWHKGDVDMNGFTTQQIENYCAQAMSKGAVWIKT